MSHEDKHQRLNAYNRLLEQVRQTWHETSDDVQPTLDFLIDRAREKLGIVEELGREEAEKIGDYLRRDLQDAVDYLAGPEARELGDWLKLDIKLIEQELLDLFTSVADPTKLELLALEERARQASEYHTGEITGIGTLYCSSCGKTLHFHKTGHIPPCPECHHSIFQREEATD
jgi:DNA-directed RNA polymerase subunit RPC12/RpoP